MSELTRNEEAMLEAILASDFQDTENPVGHMVWSFDPCDGFGTSAGGIMASLVKKGLADVHVNYDDEGNSTCWITQAGLDALTAGRKG